MSQDRDSAQDVFDIDILNARALDTPDGLQTALSVVEAICRRGDPEISGMVAALNSRSHILEYIISGRLHACP